MASLDIVKAWNGFCWWGSRRLYPDKPSFLVAIEREIYPEEAELSESEITETRLRHCVGGDCGEDEDSHWHPTDAKNGALVWQYGNEWHS